ncbi:MAG: DUF1854 domain-containing protein [Bacteriovoracaceae bacterium]
MNAEDKILKLKSDPSGRLLIDGETLEVAPCFPWEDPYKFLSLRNDEGKEVILIRDIKDVNQELYSLIQKELERRNFVFRIKRIDEIEDGHEVREYHVSTEQGLRTIMTEQEDWPSELEDGSFLIKDLSGDYYRIPSLDELDSSSKKKILPYIG